MSDWARNPKLAFACRGLCVDTAHFATFLSKVCSPQTPRSKTASEPALVHSTFVHSICTLSGLLGTKASYRLVTLVLGWHAAWKATASSHRMLKLSLVCRAPSCSPARKTKSQFNNLQESVAFHTAGHMLQEKGWVMGWNGRIL